eukprot:169466_1
MSTDNIELQTKQHTDIKEEQEEEKVDRFPSDLEHELKDYDGSSAPPPINKMGSLLNIIDNETESPLPYKPGCKYAIQYRIKTFLVIHPRIYALYLLFMATWPRGLVLLDMWSDGVVAYELYRVNEPIWFMLSTLFIIIPFVLVWSVSLRFIQLRVQTLFDKLNRKTSQTTCIHSIVNFFLMIYMFPPIGSIFIAIAEIFWVISDIYNGIKAFIFGTVQET